MMMGMYEVVVIALLTITGVFLVSAAEQSIEMELDPPGRVLEGDTLTIKCMVTGKKRFDVIRLFRRFDGEIVTIRLNQFIDTKFAQNARYLAGPDGQSGYDDDDGVITVTTVIKNVQGKDGGIIECALNPGADSSISAEEEINILVSPKSVVWLQQTVDGTWVEPDSGSVTIKRGTMSGLMCKVIIDGTSVHPTITVKIDDKDVTNMFDEEEIFDESMSPDGFKTVVRTTDWKYMTDQANIDHHGKSITCSAKLPDFPATDAQAQLQVKYAPEFDDCQAMWSAKIGSKNIRIVCRGSMYPPPLQMMWHYESEENTTVLADGEQHENVTAEQTTLDNQMYEFALAISEVHPDHFKKYKLEVDNGIGESKTFSIRFHEEVTTTTVTTTTLTSTTEEIITTLPTNIHQTSEMVIETTVIPTTNSETTLIPTTNLTTYMEPATDESTLGLSHNVIETTVIPTTYVETTVIPTTNLTTYVEPTTDEGTLGLSHDVTTTVTAITSLEDIRTEEITMEETSQPVTELSTKLQKKNGKVAVGKPVYDFNTGVSSLKTTTSALVLLYTVIMCLHYL